MGRKLNGSVIRAGRKQISSQLIIKSFLDQHLKLRQNFFHDFTHFLFHLLFSLCCFLCVYIAISNRNVRHRSGELEAIFCINHVYINHIIWIPWFILLLRSWQLIFWKYFHIWEFLDQFYFQTVFLLCFCLFFLLPVFFPSLQFKQGNFKGHLKLVFVYLVLHR